MPHITLKSIANNAEIDVIWEKWQQALEPLRARLNAALDRDPHPPVAIATGPSLSRGAGEGLAASADKPLARTAGEGAERSEAGEGKAAWEEWQIPREAGADWPEEAMKLHADWWAERIARQKEIDASIAAKAEFEYLYDKPYTDNSRTRVAGPFTVESLSPHRVMAVDEDDSLIDELADPGAGWNDFAQMVLDNLKTSGVQQAHKEDRITLTALTPWPGNLVCAEGRYLEGERERRAAIFLGPEFGTVARADLVEAAREAADARFDVVIAGAFNFDAHSAELERIGRIPILKARMNPNLHMAGELKNTGSGNLFVVFGEPDIAIEPAGDEQIRVRIKGVDVFKPQTGEIELGGPDTIALWFIDTDYNEESFFVRHAYFLGAATDPYKALKTTLRAEIDEEAWSSLNSDTSRPFHRSQSRRPLQTGQPAAVQRHSRRGAAGLRSSGRMARGGAQRYRGHAVRHSRSPAARGVRVTIEFSDWRDPSGPGPRACSRRSVHSSGRATPFPGSAECRGIGTRARFSVGEMGGLSASGATSARRPQLCPAGAGLGVGGHRKDYCRTASRRRAGSSSAGCSGAVDDVLEGIGERARSAAAIPDWQ